MAEFFPYTKVLVFASDDVKQKVVDQTDGKISYRPPFDQVNKSLGILTSFEEVPVHVNGRINLHNRFKIYVSDRNLDETIDFLIEKNQQNVMFVLSDETHNLTHEKLPFERIVIRSLKSFCEDKSEPTVSETADVSEAIPAEPPGPSVQTIIEQNVTRKLTESSAIIAVLNLRTSCEIEGNLNMGNLRIVLDSNGKFTLKNEYDLKGFIYSKGSFTAVDVIFDKPLLSHICPLSISKAADCLFEKCYLFGNIEIADSKSVRIMNSFFHKKSVNEKDSVLKLSITQTPSTIMSTVFSGYVGLNLKGSQHIIYYNNFNIDSVCYNAIGVASEAIVSMNLNTIVYGGKLLSSASWKSRVAVCCNSFLLDKSTVFMSLSDSTILNTIMNNFEQQPNIEMDPDCTQVYQSNTTDTDQSEPNIKLNNVSSRTTHVTYLF